MTEGKRHKSRFTALHWLPLVVMAIVAGCTIEPPLHLAGTEVELVVPEVRVDINTVWDLDADWEEGWFYGWDEQDRQQWGDIEYPEPPGYTVRVYYNGMDHTELPYNIDGLHFKGNRFNRRFDFGWHDLIFWSDVVTYDGMQSVVIDEKDPMDIFATTTRANLTYEMPGSRSSDVFHNPEIFYSGLEKDFYIDGDTSRYDYFDASRGVWVKHLHVQAVPRVYIYLVQVIVYNNRGRIVGLNDKAALTAMADGVSLHQGKTSVNDVVVAFPMRMKRDIPGRDGRNADIFGSRLNTFGLCGMPSWDKSRSRSYNGTRGELVNYLSLDMSFNNGTDSAYNYRVTDQLQCQCHGGIITIEIDADTLKIPQPGGGGGGSGFRPKVEDYNDTIVYEFVM